jgi:hypothetical protein
MLNSIVKERFFPLSGGIPKSGVGPETRTSLAKDLAVFIPPRGQLCEETSLQSELTLYARLFPLSIARFNYFLKKFQMGVILIRQLTEKNPGS